jgi:hypothetical protein
VEKITTKFKQELEKQRTDDPNQFGLSAAARVNTDEGV